MIEIGKMEEGEVVEAKTVEIGYRRTKMKLKNSSTISSCNFKPRTEVTLRYLNKLKNKNWIISSKNSWPNKIQRVLKSRLLLKPKPLRKKKRRSQPKNKHKSEYQPSSLQLN